MSQYLDNYQQQCDKVLALFEEDLASVKTGRAKPSLIEHIKVQAYGGSWMEVRELASISAPDAQTIEIKPWDKSVLKDLEKGIGAAEGHFNPIVQGELIRISIPALTEETRKDIVKLVYQKAESHKQMLRNERNEIKKGIESSKNQAGVSEDDVKRDLEELQKMTDETNRKIEEMTKAKEEELMKL